ncbi:MAG TPA: protein kinase [Myxococcota bacterium]|nr:protein kinase [Myxococcota bacterium]HRY93104.1 protein kinase [Myxococcota bacterium]HSA20364.1 protein kinase [Myxococcota bacterium]
MVFRPMSFGKYVLLRRIAIGGMAEVFRAKAFGAEGFEKLVAIKRMLPHLSADHQFVSMFINEAKLAASLSHANIVQIYDFGCIDNLYYLSMEYVRGKDVADIIRALRERGLSAPIEMACYVMIQSLHGLGYAHSRTDGQGQPISLVHRDMSPHNLIVSHEGEVKILDFGIAKAKSSTVQTTGGVLKGKYSYMSPEQAHGMKVDSRTDLFSLGICFYELLTLTKMFHGQNDLSVLEKVRETNFIRPRDLNENIPEELERLLLKALEKNPDDRWSSAAEWREALESFLFKAGLHYSPSWLNNFMHELFREEIAKEQVQASEEDAKADDLRTEARRVARVEAIRQSVAVQQVGPPSRPPIREVEPEPSLPSRETERAARSLLQLRSEREFAPDDELDGLDEVEAEELPLITAADEDAMPTVELSRPQPVLPGRQSIPARLRTSAPPPPVGSSPPQPAVDDDDDLGDTVHDDVRASARPADDGEGFENTVTVQDDARAPGSVTGTRPLTPADLEGSLPTFRKPRTPVRPVPDTSILPAGLSEPTARPSPPRAGRSPWQLALVVVAAVVAATAGTAWWMRAHPPEPGGGEGGGEVEAVDAGEGDPGPALGPSAGDEPAEERDAGQAVADSPDAGAPPAEDPGRAEAVDAGAQVAQREDEGKAPPPPRKQRRRVPSCSTRGTGTLDVGVVGGWAGVYIDGVKIRNTPLVGYSTRAGWHKVELRDGGGSVIRTWSVCLRTNAKLKLLHQ